LSFPKLRIIWASSPYATTEIFKDLKKNNPEPDRDKAAAIGTVDGANMGDINGEAESVLRCIPGVTDKNIRAVMSRAKNLRDLCSLSLVQVQNILGKEDGSKCYDFIHKSGRSKRTIPTK
jgi:DNA excision repair protein ERCC-4